MPVCGFLDHMFMFNSLHICAGNNSRSPHRTDHSLSGLIRHVPNLNDVGASDPSHVSLLYNGTQSPLACAINSILCSGKRADLLTLSWALTKLCSLRWRYWDEVIFIHFVPDLVEEHFYKFYVLCSLSSVRVRTTKASFKERGKSINDCFCKIFKREVFIPAICTLKWVSVHICNGNMNSCGPSQ